MVNNVVEIILSQPGTYPLFRIVEDRTLNSLGIRYKKSLDIDETMFARYKSIQIDFPEGEIPLILFHFCDALDQDSLEEFKSRIDPLFEIEETDVPVFFLAKLKKENEILKEGVSSFTVNRVDTVKWSKLKCITRPEKIYLHNKEWGNGNKV